MNSTQKHQLMDKAALAARKAYAPYSLLHIGAALLTADGRRVVTGCNVENASFGLTICAERAALASAVAEGLRKFKAIAVVAVERKMILPCGACLQVLAEFGSPDMLVLTHAPRSSRKIRVLKLGDLLPKAFRFSSHD